MDKRITTAAEQISTQIGQATMSLAGEFMKEHELNPQEYAAAVVQANLMLLAGSVAALVNGANATDEQRMATIGELVGRLQQAIGAHADI